VSGARRLRAGAAAIMPVSADALTEPELQQRRNIDALAQAARSAG